MLNLPSGTTKPVNSNAIIPPSAQTLIQRCIRCARHTCRVLSESWIKGAFPALYHDLTQYLFSSLTVLAISCLLPPSVTSSADPSRREDQCGDDAGPDISDREVFEEAVELLEQVKESGNFAAREFSRHVRLIVRVVEDALEEETRQPDEPVGDGDRGQVGGPRYPMTHAGHAQHDHHARHGNGAAGHSAGAGVSSGSVVPSLEQLLMQASSATGLNVSQQQQQQQQGLHGHGTTEANGGESAMMDCFFQGELSGPGLYWLPEFDLQE